jgi:hypothetical protein
MEGNPLYPNWDADNLTQAAYDNNTVDEDIYSAYVQAKFDGEIGGLKTQTVVGVRYEQTKVKTSAQQNVVDHFVWTSDNDFNAIFGTGLTALGDKADYSNWLPNIDFQVDITDQFKAVHRSARPSRVRSTTVHDNGSGWTVDADNAGRCSETSGATSVSRRWSRPTSISHSVVLLRQQLRVDRLLQEGGQQLRRYRRHEPDAVRSAGSDRRRARHVDGLGGYGPGCRRLRGERAEHVHHGSHPERSGDLPEWCGFVPGSVDKWRRTASAEHHRGI